MRARYYSVELMRFINEDIVLGDIGNSSSLNRYTYVEGNPATMIAPFWLCAEVSVESVLEAVHTTLDILGMFPGLGIGPDAINTILYLIEGDWKNAAHHIVAGSSPKANEARAILQKCGVDINDAANGVFLPTQKGVFNSSYHPSLHTNAYYDKVNKLLSEATCKEDVLDI